VFKQWKSYDVSARAVYIDIIQWSHGYRLASHVWSAQALKVWRKWHPTTTKRPPARLLIFRVQVSWGRAMAAMVLLLLLLRWRDASTVIFGTRPRGGAREIWRSRRARRHDRLRHRHRVRISRRPHAAVKRPVFPDRGAGCLARVRPRTRHPPTWLYKIYCTSYRPEKSHLKWSNSFVFKFKNHGASECGGRVFPVFPAE